MRNALLGGLFASFLFASPALAQGGSLTITIEGSFGSDLAAPAPAEPAPPVVVLEPARGPMPTAPSGYQLDASTVLSAPAPAYAPPEVYEAPPAPAPEAPRYRRNVGLMVGGAVMFGGMWALNIGGTLLAMTIPTTNWNRGNLFFSSLVPIGGPLAQIAFRDGDWQIPFFVAASAVQLTGLILAIVGTASRVPVEEPEETISVVPYASGEGAGLNVLGSF
jgi:hypothetical protein